jgi:DNA-binding NarL/FixJ family response regulator
VLLADDSSIMRETLVHILRQDFTIVGAVSSGAALLAEVEALNPDVILLDISLGDMSGFEVAEELKSDGFKGKLVFLSVYETPEFVRAAFDLGASGYVFKSQISEDLVSAIRAVSNGHHFLPRQCASLKERIGASRSFRVVFGTD